MIQVGTRRHSRVLSLGIQVQMEFDDMTQGYLELLPMLHTPSSITLQLAPILILVLESLCVSLLALSFVPLLIAFVLTVCISSCFLRSLLSYL